MTRAYRVRGCGHASGHYGEIVQGIFQGNDGNAQRGLVTMPCPLAVVHAAFEGSADKALEVSPSTSKKALNAARLTLDRLGQSSFGGVITIESNIPEGLGMGSSTADVIATIRAVSNAFKKDLPFKV